MREKDSMEIIFPITRYIDNWACYADDEELYQQFLTNVKTKYDLSNNCDLKWHLRIKITQRPWKGTTSLAYKAYVDSLCCQAF